MLIPIEHLFYRFKRYLTNNNRKYHWISDYEKQKYHWVSDYEKQKYHRVSDYEKQKYHRVSDYEKQKYHWVSDYEKEIPFCLIINSEINDIFYCENELYFFHFEISVFSSHLCVSEWLLFHANSAIFRVSDYEKQKYHRVSDYEKQKYHRVSDYEKQKYHWVSDYEKQIFVIHIIATLYIPKIDK
jgi:hypothetical protein